jgi:hypothetical protein
MGLTVAKIYIHIPSVQFKALKTKVYIKLDSTLTKRVVSKFGNLKTLLFSSANYITKYIVYSELKPAYKKLKIKMTEN